MLRSKANQRTARSWSRTGLIAVALAIATGGCQDNVDVVGPDSSDLATPGDPQLAFVSTRGGAEAIYVANEDGTLVGRLTNGWGPQWSPDGTKIAFYRVFPGSPPHSYVINVDGRGERLIADAGAVPSWSPDGTRLLYTSPVGTPNGGVFVVDVDGTNTQLLLSDDFDDPGSGDHLSDASWSPDGRTIAFVRSNYDKGSQIFIMNADGSSPRVLISTLPSLEPSWSPDGRTIAFGSFRNIGSINADGTDYRTYDPSLAFNPDWSPDGSKLVYNAFASTIGDEISGLGSRMRLYVLDRQTGGTRQLIPEATSPAKANYWDHQASWRRPKQRLFIN